MCFTQFLFLLCFPPSLWSEATTEESVGGLPLDSILLGAVRGVDNGTGLAEAEGAESTVVGGDADGCLAWGVKDGLGLGCWKAGGGGKRTREGCGADMRWDMGANAPEGWNGRGRNPCVKEPISWWRTAAAGLAGKPGGIMFWSGEPCWGEVWWEERKFGYIWWGKCGGGIICALAAVGGGSSNGSCGGKSQRKRQARDFGHGYRQALWKCNCTWDFLIQMQKWTVWLLTATGLGLKNTWNLWTVFAVIVVSQRTVKSGAATLFPGGAYLRCGARCGYMPVWALGTLV